MGRAGALDQLHMFLFIGIVAADDGDRGFGGTEVGWLMGQARGNVEKIAGMIDHGVLQMVAVAGQHRALNKVNRRFRAEVTMGPGAGPGRDDDAIEGKSSGAAVGAGDTDKLLQLLLAESFMKIKTS